MKRKVDNRKCYRELVMVRTIKYVCNVSPYYYFQFTDPDGNVIEVTGEYTPKEGEFDE